VCVLHLLSDGDADTASLDKVREEQQGRRCSRQTARASRRPGSTTAAGPLWVGAVTGGRAPSHRLKNAQPGSVSLHMRAVQDSAIRSPLEEWRGDPAPQQERVRAGHEKQYLSNSLLEGQCYDMRLPLFSTSHTGPPSACRGWSCCYCKSRQHRAVC
jgi:hypothetical protein